MLELERLLVRLMMDATQYDRMVASVERKTTAAAKKIASLGTKLSMAFTVPLLGFAATSIWAFASFDAAMTNSLSIMRGITPEIRKEMERTAISLSNQGTKTATELAESYYFLASAGMTARQSIAAMPIMTRFAAAGNFGMAKATDLLTDALTASGFAIDETGESLSKLGDHILLASIQANATAEQFAISLISDAGTAAHNFGMEIETTMALLGAYASSGQKAEESGNALGRAIRLLTSAYRSHGEAFKVYGVDVVDEATGKYRNFIDIIADLENGVGKLPPAMRDSALEMMGFESLSQKAILPLIGLSSQMKIWEAEQRKAAGTMKDVAEKQLLTFSKQMAITKNKITNISVEIGQRLVPFLQKLNSTLQQGLAMWGSLSEATKDQISLYGAIAAIVGPALIAVGAVIKLSGMALAVVGLLFRPIVLGISLLLRGFQTFSSVGSSSFSVIGAAASRGAAIMISAYQTASSVVSSSFVRMRAAALTIQSAYSRGFAASSTATKAFAISVLRTGQLIRNSMDPAYLKASWESFKISASRSLRGAEIGVLKLWRTIRNTFSPAYMKAVWDGWRASAISSFAQIRAAGLSTARTLRTNFMTVMGRVGGAVGGLAMAGGTLGMMGIGGVFAPILAMAPLAISLLGSFAGAAGALISPFALITGAAVLGGIAWMKYSGAGQEALGSLMKGSEDYRAIASETFSGVKAALKAGDLSSAAAIAWAGLKAEWYTGIADLSEKWGSYIKAIVESFAGAMAGIGGLWNQTVDKLSKKMLELASQEGVLGDAMRDLLGVDPRKSTANATMKNMQRSALSEQIRQWEEMIRVAEASGSNVITMGSPDDPILRTIDEVRGFIAESQGKMQTEGYGLSAEQLGVADSIGVLEDMTAARQALIDQAVMGTMGSLNGLDPEGLRAQATEARNAVAGLTMMIGSTGNLKDKSIACQASVDSLTQSLQNQVLTYGMSSTEAELLSLEMQGATVAQLAQAKALNETLKEREKLKDLESEAMQIIEANLTPMEKYNKQLEKLQKMTQTIGADGRPLLDSMNYARALDAAQKELEEAQKNADDGIVAKFKVDTSGLNDARTAMDQLRFLQALNQPTLKAEALGGISPPAIAGGPEAGLNLAPAIPMLEPIEPTSMSGPEDLVDISPMVDALSDIRDGIEMVAENTNPDKREEPVIFQPLGLRHS